MSIRVTLAIIAMALLAITNPSHAGTLTSDTLAAGSQSGSRDRQYQVYVPDNLTTPAPMVMALHGCSQTQANVMNEWGLQAAADQYGFILVTPFITSYDGLRNQNCWGFWFDQHRHEGAGEPQDLVRIGQAIESQYSVDADRRYITGLSSGGAMAEVAAITHNEYWAAAASASGLPYGEDASSVSLSGQCPGSATFHGVSRVASDIEQELNDSYPIPMMVLQSENDCTVVQPAGRNIRDAHLRVFGDSSHDTPITARQSESDCSPAYQNDYQCVHTVYGNGDGRSVVETVFFDGPINTANSTDTNHGHFWVGGVNGSEGPWAVRAGPSYPDIIWDFFNRHSRTGSVSNGQPTITVLGDNPLDLTLDQSFSDPGATATDPEDGNLSVNADCSSVDTSQTGDYTCQYTATDSDSNTVARTRTVRVTDPSAPTASCATEIASPSAHVTAGRAEKGGSFNLRALSLTDRQDIGASYDTWSSVTLHEGEPGTWYAAEPEACRTGGGNNGGGQPCEEWYGSNLQHQNANRAYYQMGYFTVGGDDALGAISGGYNWVYEAAPGEYRVGQCP
ncbi:extracellular catalytic domain type 1 short-chain-length polyhydroxyalkanoate depolymerase [Marinobacter sp. V034]|uniref:extracellular catalytic domain type 1 short-chain-length polyhydroxyalkanoate depolymerase n=1 Tax=Marinobacter sp. V034 TaxID=3459610 RepID=UPI0040444BFE